MIKNSLIGKDLSELEEYCISYKFPKFHGNQLYKWMYNKYTFDKENSYYNYIKSFPLNTEIDIYLHYKSKNPQDRFTLASTKSMMHRYHISISAIESSYYTSRLEDDRVGYFTTMYQDYSKTLKGIESS